MFPLLLKRTADVLVPLLSVVFRRLVRLGSYSSCCRQANFTPIPKGPPSSSVVNYQPICLTSVLYKVFERLVPGRLSLSMKRRGVLPTTQFANRKDLGSCDALCVCSINSKVYWRVCRRLRSCRLVLNQSIKFFRQRGHRAGTWVAKIQIRWVKINDIR